MSTSFRVGFLLMAITLSLCLFSLTTNFLVIAANNWKMPVKSELVSWETNDSLHKEMDESTRLRQLGDIFPVRNTMGQIVAIESIGDKARATSAIVLFASIPSFVLPWLSWRVTSKIRG